jgi:exosortase
MTTPAASALNSVTGMAQVANMPQVAPDELLAKNSVVPASPPQLQSELKRRPSWIHLVANALLLAAAYGPLVVPFFARQWSLPQYQYFPFVIGAFIWLLVRNSRHAEHPILPITKSFKLLTMVCISGSWALLGLAYFVPSPWLAAISALLLIGVGLLKLSRQRHIHYAWGLWLMLWLVVPLPLNRDQQLITGLQRLSSRLSSTFLDALGVEHLMEDNTLTLPGKQFFVDEACSGIVSLLSVITCAVIYGIWRDRRGAHVVILAFCGVGWATLMNVGRITTIAVVYDWFDADWSTGAIHEILGLVFFLFVFLALVCTDMFLVGLLAPIEPTLREVAGTPQPLGRNWMRFWDWLFFPAPSNSLLDEEAPIAGITRRFQPMALGWASLVAFAVLPALTFAMGGFNRNERRTVAVIPQQLVDRALACQQNTLPAQIQHLSFAKFSPVQRDHNDILGNFSRTYEYRDTGGMLYIVSCDFPYQGGWHELTICYRGIGWDLSKRRVIHESKVAKGQRWTNMEAAFTKPDGSQGFLTASAFDEYGNPLDLPAYTLFEDIWRRITEGAKGPSPEVAFQVQVWVVSAQPIRNEQQDTARTLLRDARERFYKAIVGSAAKSSL